MSKEPNIKEDLCYIPNITDAVSFAYKKTIGALKTSELLVSSSSQIKYLKESALIMKTLFQECYLKYNNEDNLLDKLEYINLNFRSLLFKIYYNESNHYIYEKITSIIYNIEDYDYRLLFIKVYLELFLHVLNKNISKNKLYLLFDTTYEKFKDNSVYKFTELKNFKKTILYSDMKKYVYSILNK